MSGPIVSQVTAMVATFVVQEPKGWEMTERSVLPEIQADQQLLA